LGSGGKRAATPLWVGQRLAFLDVPGGRKPASSGRFALACALHAFFVNLQVPRRV